MRGVLVALIVLLAGCSGSAHQGTMDGAEASAAAADAVAGRFEYLLYLGTTGTEGPLNWTAYEDAMRAAADPGTMIADAFDQDVDNGDAGDGVLGSWLSTHFVFDGERRLLGGLYTQTTTEGSKSVYAPFRGPYSGTLALPSLHAGTGAKLLAFEMMQNSQGNTTLCGLTSQADIRIDSATAADIAMQRTVMQEHVANEPNGEFTYYYFPQLGVEANCPATLDVTSNYWIVSHADLDVYLDGGVPTVAEVIIDAATGEVIDEGLRPVFRPAPTVVDHLIAIQDPLLPAGGPSEDRVMFPVEEGAARLDVTALRTQSPQMERDGYTRLLDPNGLEWGSHPNSRLLHEYAVRDPAPGEWSLEYVSFSLEPNGQHEVHVRGVVHHV